MTSASLRIAIIGAGASGMAACIELRKAGVTNIEIFEKAAEVGGTWRDNRYPGLACDVPSHLYRFSFAPYAQWTREYAAGPEILGYLKKVAQDFDLASHIRFSHELRDARFEEGRWRVITSQGDQGLFNALILATGVLHKPVIPEIAGADDFAGAAFHSSQWRADAPIAGARVGVIGTGSTAVQIFPAIVDQTQTTSLFQRTPQWITPVENRAFTPEKMAAFRDEPERMSALYESLADKFNHRFAAALVGANAEGLDGIVRACQDNLRDNVRDPDLRARLTPDYAVGCKRLIVSSAFYPAIQKPNAHLVDQPIERMEARGVRTKDGVLHELDTIVYATGFDPFNFFKPARILGRNGADLGARWEKSSRAHRTICAPDFPNLFFIGGPNSPIGNFSFLMTAEMQIAYIIGLIGWLRDGEARTVEPSAQATDAFNADIEAAMGETIWAKGGCQSWYFDKSGKVASWPWTYERFQKDLSAPVRDEYLLG